MKQPSRNQQCPCGSGKRFKDCHGQLGGMAGMDPATATREQCGLLMGQALAEQQARRLDEAERLYREALALVPDEPDALHMLGVIRYERGDWAGAKNLVIRALDLSGWQFPSMRQNLGLILAKEGATSDTDASESLRERYRAFQSARDAARHAAKPLVSVVVPSFNHVRYVERALRSVFEQRYPRIELVVIDDGSRDGSPGLIEACLRQSPLPHKLVARENRGAPATLNEGIALARGDFVQFLNSDDWFAEDRIERMVAAVAGTGSEWGFASVDVVDGESQAIDPMHSRWTYDLRCSIAAIPFRETVGSGFITGNLAVSSGNLFIARGLLDRLGGFHEYRYNHDWDLCLRALMRSEPAFVPEQLYFYRLHSANTIAESAEKARAEARTVCGEYLAWAQAAVSPENPFAPAKATWGQLFTNAILSGGMGGLLDADAIRKLAVAATC